MLSLVPRAASAAEQTSLDVSPALQTLVQRHSPILLLKEQSHPCDTLGEPYNAGPADLILDNPSVVLRRAGPGDEAPISGPTAADLAQRDDSFYIDLPGDPLRAGCTYERQSRARMAMLTPTANVHIARQEGRDGFAIQYWLLYLYNDFNNKHEGDWEMIQVVYDVNTVEEALQTHPVEVGYAQHGGGERAAWNDPKFDREDGHPIVHVSRGSHASQYDSAVYLGWGENGTGFGCDVTLGPSVRQPLDTVLIADDTSESPRGVAWTSYEGHWGQRGPWEFDGPRGPNTTSKWNEPLTWQDRLRDGSLAVPLSGALGPAPTQVFCTVSAASADLFRIGAEQPLLAVLYVFVPLSIFILLLALSWNVLRDAAMLYARNFRYFVWPAVMIVAIGVVVVLIRLAVGWLYQASPFSDTPAIWAGFTFVLSVLQPLVGIIVVAPPAIYAVARVRSNRLPDDWKHPLINRKDYAQMLRALTQPTLVVAGISVLPLGVVASTYLFVRRVFIPQAVLLDGCGPDEARAASLNVTRGQWLRTAALVALLAVLVVIPSPIAGIALLVYFGQSVALVNLVSSVVFALVIPFIFVALTHEYMNRADTMLTGRE
jgi:hypothetical protein